MIFNINVSLITFESHMLHQSLRVHCDPLRFLHLLICHSCGHNVENIDFHFIHLWIFSDLIIISTWKWYHCVEHSSLSMWWCIWWWMHSAVKRFSMFSFLVNPKMVKTPLLTSYPRFPPALACEEFIAEWNALVWNVRWEVSTLIFSIYHFQNFIPLITFEFHMSHHIWILQNVPLLILQLLICN